MKKINNKKNTLFVNLNKNFQLLIIPNQMKVLSYQEIRI